MIGRKSLARISSKPGKTQTLNFYKIEEQLFFVDVPGYGYAKVSKTEREAWGKMIEMYFTDREPLKAVVQIVDLRHRHSTSKLIVRADSYTCMSAILEVRTAISPYRYIRGYVIRYGSSSLYRLT